MDDFRYAYAVARINALSVKLLDREFASRILAAEPNEVLRILGETAYAESFAVVENPTQIETGLFRELRKTHELLDDICPEKKVIRLFRVRHDFHNLKAMLKSQISGVPHADSIMDLGTYSLGELSAAVREKNYRFVPEFIRDTALEALAEYEKVSSLEAISYICNRSMWSYLHEKAKRYRNKIVIKLFCEYVNLWNIKTFFRVKEFAENPNVFKRYFIEGGSYGLDFFLQHMDRELGLFLDHLAKTQYEHDIVSEGFMMWPDEKSFWRLEIASDNFLLRQFWNMRMSLFSIAPLIYYLLRKTAEIKLIRAVMRCKLNGMSRGQIEERLRYFYV